jgi:hypothetical protein
VTKAGRPSRSPTTATPKWRPSKDAGLFRAWREAEDRLRPVADVGVSPWYGSDEAAGRDMSLLKDWLKRGAAKRMAGPLASFLATSYGSSQTYTPAQIRTAFSKLKLNAKYIDVAYAQYLDFDEYNNLVAGDQASYDAARLLYERYTPYDDWRPMDPAPVNAYVKQAGGGR